MPTKPREPDGYEEKARELVNRRGWTNEGERAARIEDIAAALRQAADEALERAAQAITGPDDEYLRKRVRALASPAAAPAAEPCPICRDTGKTACKAPPSEPAADQDEVAMFGAFGHGEPVAPAPYTAPVTSREPEKRGEEKTIGCCHSMHEHEPHPKTSDCLNWTPLPSLAAPDLRSVRSRITEYLSLGGLFNPEAMDHGAVSRLLRDTRDAIDAALAGGEK